MTENAMGKENVNLLVDSLTRQVTDGCGPAIWQTVYKAGHKASGRLLGRVPTLPEIAEKLYTWKYFVLRLFQEPRGFKFKDNWCLPETKLQTFATQFTDTRFIEGKESSLDLVDELLQSGYAVAVLIQDLVPYKQEPKGNSPKSLDNGHWVLITEVDKNRQLVRVLDPSKVKDGNQIWLGEGDVVLADGEVKERGGYTLVCQSHYWMNQSDFEPHWWDWRLNEKDKYIRPIVAVKLDSLR